MATRKSVTKSRYKSTIPPVEFGLLTKFGLDREYQTLLRHDGEIAVAVINAALGTAAHERLVAIRQGLEEFRHLAAVALQIAVSGNALAKMDTKKRKAFNEKYKRLTEHLVKLHTALNGSLAKYTFRPWVDFEAVAADGWRTALIPDQNRRGFEAKIDRFTISEADAVMALVRLDANGELAKVKLCEHCRRVWFYAKRPTFDKHCSKECREADYKEDPKYLARKAKNQKNFRLNEKRKAAREIANLTKL